MFYRVLLVGLFAQLKGFIAECQVLKTGDVFPAIAMRVSNFKEESISFSKLRGKLVILDFWSPGCVPCIQSFPRIDSLQKEFGERIQIILVCKETKDSIGRFFETRKKIKRPDLPFIEGDSLLHKWFPHYGAPYHVWIDGGGQIKYMTDGFNASKENIQKVLQNNFPKLVSRQQPLFKHSLFDSNYFNSLVYFSYISHCDPDVRLSQERRKNYEQLYMNCVSVAELYVKAYNELKKFEFHKPGRMMVEGDEAVMYVRPKDVALKNEWFDQNSFSYHLFIPVDRAGQKYKLMQSDLDRYFNLDVCIEKRKVSCFVLVRTSNDNKLASKGGDSRHQFYYSNVRSGRHDSLRFIRNMPYESFTNSFRNYVELQFHRSFIDSTGLHGPIDIVFRGDTIDSLSINMLNKELAKYELLLLEKEVLFDVLVLRNKNNNAGH